MNVHASLDLTAVNRVFGELKRRANDFRKPFFQAGQNALQEFEQTFASHGPGWAPNKGNNPVLDKTGALRRSFTVRGAPGNRWVVNREEAQFGSDVPYAAVHQTGGDVVLPGGRRITLPARPIVKVPSPAYQVQLASIAHEHFTVGLA